MEFKGTKTKWIKSKNSIGFVYAEKLDGNTKVNAFSLNINNDGRISNEEIKANALLISKSPELLDMLNELTNIKSHSFILDELQEKAKQLIKEATTI